MLQDTIVIDRPGGPEVLVPARRDIPSPGPGQVLIRVQAAGINRHDCGQRSRGPNGHESDIPGLEVAGTVHALGEGVAGPAPGTPVCALVDGGGYAQFAVAQAELVLPVPDGFTPQEAACIPEAAFTAWYNLFVVGALQPGESVLLHGGTSGVGVFAIQMLAALGYPAYATCGTDEKAALAEKLGARSAFNYKSDDFAARLKDEGVEIDVVLDMSGARHTEKNLEALAYGGRIVHLSGGTGTMQVTMRALMQKEARVTGSLMRPLALPRKIRVAEALRSVVWPLLGERIRPIVNRVYALNEAADAHRHLESGDNVGKLILRVDPPLR